MYTLQEIVILYPESNTCVLYFTFFLLNYLCFHIQHNVSIETWFFFVWNFKISFQFFYLFIYIFYFSLFPPLSLPFTLLSFKVSCQFFKWLKPPFFF
ncbi:hypothetical protein EDC96DRAFT_169773 [Choanephora cucurbitarum]|nr:hypothetical protein EDC96DRAFT_169773 [Choanephora cucurbitarum]